MKNSRHTLGIVFFPAFDWAISPTHPERQERLLYTQDQLREEGLFDRDGIAEYKPDIASHEDIARVHFCFPDIDSVITRSHLISAGGAIRAARLVMEKTADRAFAIVRPPGHHAMKVVHGARGYCTINIEAVMIEYIREHYGRKKIAVVDTDCHHGDGTQDIYWHDPDVLYISIHQDGRTLYPGSGFPGELGGPGAAAGTINIPLPPRTTDEGFLYVLDRVVMPILEDFQPDLIINSAGQDNHYSDPITNMQVSARGYASLSQRLQPDIAVLEGGYSVQGALPYVNLGIALAMAGLDCSHVREPDFDPADQRQDDQTTAYIEKVSEIVRYRYFHPDTFVSVPAGTDCRIRSKKIAYDTDCILERQLEYVRICPRCPGVRHIETASSRTPLSAAIEVPFGACRTCAAEGAFLFEWAKQSGKYRYIGLIDRRRKRYLCA